LTHAHDKFLAAMFPAADPATQAEREAWRARVTDGAAVEHAARALLAGDLGPIADSLIEAGIGRPSIEIEPSESALDLPPLIALHRFWAARRGPGGAPPPASSIDPAELRGALGNVHRLETDATGNDYVYRVYGSAVTAHAGQDWTGWTIGAMTLKTETGLGIFYRALQAACALARAPVASQHNSPPWLTASSWRRLTVPFLDDSGAPTHFLVATVPIAFRRRSVEEEAEFLRRVSPRAPED
jgi:hypothetical protein